MSRIFSAKMFNAERCSVLILSYLALFEKCIKVSLFKASASFDGTVAVWDRKSGQVPMLKKLFLSVIYGFSY